MSESSEVKHELGRKDADSAGKPKARRRLSKRSILAAPLLLLALLLISAVYVYAVSPASVRKPRIEHLHFRMQIVMDGKAVDFAKQPFQEEYEKGQCSGDLPMQPFHFHDGKDQFVHVHWKGMTGGELLKFYGWNVVGGVDDTLGYRLDDLPKVQKVPIHGSDLPRLPKDATFWVYTGSEKGYQQRSLDRFKSQTLEQFFNKRSNFMSYAPEAGNRLFNWFFPTASAHAGHNHETETTTTTTPTSTPVSEEERLTRINNLIGNVVIFVQNEEPSHDQITERFANLAPLSDSTCGG